jgi:hypothetical protein
MEENKMAEKQLVVEEETIQLDEPQDVQDIDINSLSDRKFGEKTEKPKLGGKKAVILEVKLRPTCKVSATKDGTKKYEPLILTLTYEIDGQQYYENYGGMQRFIHDGEPGQPTVWAEGKNAAAVLFKLWREHTGKKLEDVSVKEWLGDLVGKQVELTEKVTMYEGNEGHKNVVSSFIG